MKPPDPHEVVQSIDTLVRVLSCLREKGIREGDIEGIEECDEMIRSLNHLRLGVSGAPATT